MKWRRIETMSRKELTHIARDPRSLGMALAIPALMLLLFGFALSLDVDRIPVLIYDADRSAKSRDVIERFRGSRYFEIRGFTNSYETIEKQIDQSKILLGIAIPPDYSRKISLGTEAEIQLLIDGSDSNTASIALGYAESLIRNYSLELRAEGQNLKGGRQPGGAPIDARLRVWYNSRLVSRNYVVPGLIAVILMIIASLLTSLTIAREWEMGTMEQLLSTPLRPAEIVVGKMFAFFVVGLIDMAIAIGVGVLIFHVPLRGSVPLLIVTSCIFLFGTLFWGIFLSAVSKSQLIAFQMGMLTSFLPAFMLSGFVYALEGMPPAIQVVSRLVPARYFVTMLKGIFLKGVGLEVLWPELVFLTAYAAVVFLLATRKLKQKLA